MKEVSCKVIAPVLREAEKRKLPADTLTAGTSYDLAHLRNGKERIHWHEFAQIMANARGVWSEDELVEIGARIVISPIMKPVTLVARLLFSAKDFYFWVNKGPGKGAGGLLFTCIQPTCREAGRDRLEIELMVHDGYAPCREFFLLSKGGFAAVPEVLGLGRAHVEMEELPRGARYRVHYPSGGGAVRWVGKAVAWPFSARAVARQLMEANEVLEARYQELDQARQVLALQATQLQTAHMISQLIHGDLDLDRTLVTVAKTLVEVAGFAGSEVRLHPSADRLTGGRTVTQGARPARGRTFDVPLDSRGRALASLRLWAKDAEDSRQEALLEAIVPTIAMAIDNAITYQALADYRANLETKVQERTAELSQARDTLEETVKDLRRAQETRDRIFANINHEIRTPLALITLAVDALKAREGARPDPESRNKLAIVELGARKLLRLVDELLLLAAGREDKLQLTRSAIDVAGLLKLLVGSWTPAAKLHGLTLSYHGPERLVVSADEIALERVVANLLSNALKFTPHGGTVQVQLAERAPLVEITVSDTGIGIDDEFRSRIFGRFEQGRQPVHAGARGSGIGLSLVKELVEAHGGTVGVESPDAGGSRFCVRLPLERQGGAPRAVSPLLSPSDFGLSAGSVTPPAASAAAVSAATILVAEDDPNLAEEVAALLRHDYRVLVAADGLAALELARANLPDLLLSDVGLPGMGGLELTRRFRELPGNRLAPVVLLTAYASASDRLSGFEAGAVDYVTKPFDPTELKARVRSQLALKSMALRLHDTEKLAALGTLAAGLAHELRNPANAIVNAVEPLRDLLPLELRRAESPVAQLLSVLSDCSEQVAHLSRQLLGFNRPDQIEGRDLPFGDVISRALSLTGPSLTHVEFRDEARYRGPVWCAAPLMTQVLANLIENAAHAAGPNGWVQLATRAEDERLVVEVSDSGPGVPPELRERIFEPFFTTKAPGAGTGLGLSTARDIVSRHQGILDVRNHSHGSVFHLEIPLSRGAP